MLRKVVSASFLLLFIACYAVSKGSVDELVKTRRLEKDIRYLPSPEFAQFLSIGFKNALADFFWIEGLNYFGSEFSYLARKDRDRSEAYKYLEPYCDLILSLDPLFEFFYEWAGTVFTYNGLEITRKAVATATNYANHGIRELDKVHRYHSKTIVKAAFNYSLELNDYANSLDYFTLTARSDRGSRKMLLVAASYADNAGLHEQANQFRLEFLGHIAFEARNREELRYAIYVLSSPASHSQATNFVRNLRVNMEKDEDLRKLVERRLKDNPVLADSFLSPPKLDDDPRLNNVLNVDTKRNWLPPELHVLLSL